MLTEAALCVRFDGVRVCALFAAVCIAHRAPLMFFAFAECDYIFGAGQLIKRLIQLDLKIDNR